MKPIRIVVLTVAAVSAIGLAVVVRMALTGKPTSQAAAHTAVKPKPTARVLTASRDLKIGERLTDGDLQWKAWPVEEIQADWTREEAAVQVATATPASGTAPASSAAPAAPAPAPAPTGSTKQVDANGAVLSVSGMTKALQGGPKQPFLGAVVRLPIQAGEPITKHKIVRAGDSGYLAVVLEPGKRAASIPVTVDQAAGGFILPGDRVDVLMTRKLDGANGKAPTFQSQTVLRNMKVLAVDQTTQPDKDATAVIGATATLEVDGEEAETLAAAKAAGTLSLTLRSYSDARLGTGAGAPALRSFGGESTTGASGASDSGVRVFRYGQASESAQ